jgi:hypothetical protein
VHQHPDRLAYGVPPDLQALGQLVLGRDLPAERPAARVQLLPQLLDRGVDERASPGGLQTVVACSRHAGLPPGRVAIIPKPLARSSYK